MTLYEKVFKAFDRIAETLSPDKYIELCEEAIDGLRIRLDSKNDAHGRIPNSVSKDQDPVV